MSLQNLPIDKIKQILIRNGVSFAAIFGSYAKDEATSKSDIDFLIEYEKNKTPGLFGFIGLAHELEDSLDKKVDLVTRNGLNKDIKDEVLKTMQIIYEE